jgi:hypothetical protein
MNRPEIELIDKKCSCFDVFGASQVFKLKGKEQ